MKHALLYILLVLGICGCNSDKEDIANGPELPKRKINYVLSGNFSSKYKSALTNQANDNNLDTLKKYVKQIQYRCYDSSGRQVSKEIQYSTSEDFGTIKDQLADGEYDVVFFASSDGGGDSGNSSRDELSFATFMRFYHDSNIHTDTRTVDCFVYKSKITVKEGYTPPSVVLERITSGLEIQIEDDFPQSVVDLTISLNTQTSYYPFNPAKGKIESLYSLLDVYRSKKTYLSYVTPPPDSVLTTDVTLRAWSPSDRLVAEKQIKGVQFRTNYRTILKGKLFAPNEEGSAFTVKVDTTNLGIYDEIQY